MPIKEAAKTPEYTKKAIRKYQQNFDRVNVNLPKGTAARIRATGKSVNSVINELVEKYLLENE